uniref:Uncharacterized protein n=1 Tax=Avena sativa TaxID=4498 RepID=A0ACD6AUH0_AVESA
MSIFATLEIPDLIRAGAVCPSWYSAYTSLRSLGHYKLPQTPCLFYTSESSGDNVACLYSLREKRLYKITLPEPPIRTRYLIGSSHGWLVTVDDRSEMHLLNPITCEQIALPSVITIEQVKPIFDEYGVLHKYEFSRHSGMYNNGYNSPLIFALDKLRDKLHYKAFVFDDTSTGSYIVVLIHNPMRQLSFARAGAHKWTWLPPYDIYDDCTYKNDILYAVTGMGEIHAFDLSGPVVTMKMITGTSECISAGSAYIVQDPWGDLLLICRIFEDYDLEPDHGAPVFWKTGNFNMYGVDVVATRSTRTSLCLLFDAQDAGQLQKLAGETSPPPCPRAPEHLRPAASSPIRSTSGPSDHADEPLVSPATSQTWPLTSSRRRPPSRPDEHPPCTAARARWQTAAADAQQTPPLPLFLSRSRPTWSTSAENPNTKVVDPSTLFVFRFWSVTFQPAAASPSSPEVAVSRRRQQRVRQQPAAARWQFCAKHPGLFPA